ncbi:CDP-diacylglycerol--serine O-phosphatidyltransferase [Moraxella osloensis]|uniref:CDP-diacylglycerol--serine O-phosphatidyltransferase n=1 Tax=Faucicola osloensis TaxID=34062 RepID=A0AAW6T979_FAUOS|nr:CDP-diacylglycerol--serine O-phosphatidyltransferase [Moraxella osloensis]MDI4508916.1 CDP-diacylglycerol--serine O-phosphatidyltransferase [Moraxella osloensis]
MNNDNNQPTLIKTPIDALQQPPPTQDINPIQLEHQRNRELAETDDYDGLTFEVIENARVADKTIAQKGVYLIPNSFTLLSLLAAFYSITQSALGEGHYMRACVAIFISALLDGLDGRAARLFNAQSPFGEQMDSLVDCIAFGLAPALLIYNYALQPLGRIGIACAFVYVACAAMRLARFNVQIGVVDKKYFIGVASPLAAILISTFIMVNMDERVQSLLPHTGTTFQIMAAIWVVVVGLLMVSNLKYYSFKEFDKKRVPFVALILIVFVLGIVLYDIPAGLLAISVIYALSGMVTAIWHRVKKPTAASVAH